MAWSEDTRRMSNGEQFLLAAFAAASMRASGWQGYWRRSVRGLGQSKTGIAASCYQQRDIG
jgi:hypothetical protein